MSARVAAASDRSFTPHYHSEPAVTLPPPNGTYALPEDDP